jgi:hypothetical protein
VGPLCNATHVARAQSKDQDLRTRNLLQSMFARAVMATGLVDRGYRSFDRLRSKFVVAWGSDEFFDVYNDLIYARKQSYRLATKGLFPYEERAISQHFPSPPGTVLVGAAGGGREALALARQGYRVVAFEPARPLAASLAQVCDGLPIESLNGRYEDLPFVSSLSNPPTSIDLRSRAPFSAAILGWASLSHLRSDHQCIGTLRQFGELTRGPILVSYFPSSGGPARRFRVNVGFYRPLTGANIRTLAEHAGLDVLCLDDENHWHAVLRSSSSGTTNSENIHGDHP